MTSTILKVITASFGDFLRSVSDFIIGKYKNCIEARRDGQRLSELISEFTTISYPYHVDDNENLLLSAGIYYLTEHYKMKRYIMLILFYELPFIMNKFSAVDYNLVLNVNLLGHCRITVK